MSYLGPGVTLIPPHKQAKWRQKWWWREKLPGIIALLVVGMLALVVGWVSYNFTGFGDDSDGGRVPESSRSAAASPGTSAAPTVDPPVFESLAKEKSLAGVKEFVEYYFDVLNYTRRTNDVSVLQAIQLEDQCAACRNQQDIFENYEAERQRVSGGKYQVRSIAATPVDADTYFCSADFTVTGAALLAADGTTVETLSSEDANNQLTQQIIWSDNSWQIVAQSDRRAERN